MTKDRIQGQKDGLTWPEWRLNANFLQREIVRLWYGKKSIFTLVKGDAENAEFWELFGVIFFVVVKTFGQAHGLTADEINRRYESAGKACRIFSQHGVVPRSIPDIFAWLVHWVLGDKLASEFLFDPQITEIIIVASVTYGHAAEGKMPPYAKGDNLRPIEFYEGLPVAPELERQFYGKNRPNPVA